LAFGVCDLGLGVWGLWSGSWCLGFVVWVLRFGVSFGSESPNLFLRLNLPLPLPYGAGMLQGYLAHKKHTPRRTLQ
jgi:hypothetical protein